MYTRYVQQKVESALSDTPVVVIAGPRQGGKTTLAQSIVSKVGRPWRYVTLDDQVQLNFAKQDPIGFVRSFSETPVVIDEVQRAPELFLGIKQAVDERREPGRFLLTGSAQALMIPELADALTGRMEVVPLLPLAQCEIRGVPSTFLGDLLAGKVPHTQETRVRSKLIEAILKGGFPEPLSRELESRRFAWHLQYLNHIVQRDVRDLGQIAYLHEMPKFIRALAGQVSCLTQYTELAGKVGLARQTAVRYLELLAQLFLFETLPAWHSNEGKRLTKSPKMHIVDTGLLCAVRRITQARLEKEPQGLGVLLESYVFCELKRLASFLEEPISFYHYRDEDQCEVDIVLETLAGAVIGIEVKASATVGTKDFAGLERLKAASGAAFSMGILLYDGDHPVTYQDTLFAVPIGALWR